MCVQRCIYLLYCKWSGIYEAIIKKHHMTYHCALLSIILIEWLLSHQQSHSRLITSLFEPSHRSNTTFKLS